VNFWDNKEDAEKTIEQINRLKKQLKEITQLQDRAEASMELIGLLEDEYEDEVKVMLEQEITILNRELEKLSKIILLNGPYDKNNAILEIHAGAGGTEACDWANMLYRMYLRWCEANGYEYEIIDCQAGEETGIKSAYVLIKGDNAYGFLKCEKGVHRLVRLSPFDANKKRHTSFASVEAIPEIDNSIEVEIKEQELKIDVYRSSGAGGQSVNTTDSAVRITHLPTKIIVTCQNERSQLQNKERALMVLRSKLYQLEQEKLEESISSLKESNMSINFGSQIRSYVMHPYSMVKDHRTNIETSNVSKVLDGELNIFIEAYLKEVCNDK
jgi:peptide chain release factor 2